MSKYLDNKPTINEALIQYKSGNLKPENVFYDWFCTKKALANRGKILFSKLNSILPTTKFDVDKTYVFFKNNCPLSGNLYDDFRICDIKTGKVLYTVSPSVGYSNMNGEATVWGKDNNFEEALVTGTWKDVKKFFLGI